jgi:hypothetical protein
MKSVVPRWLTRYRVGEDGDLPELESELEPDRQSLLMAAQPLDFGPVGVA